MSRVMIYHDEDSNMAAYAVQEGLTLAQLVSTMKQHVQAIYQEGLEDPITFRWRDSPNENNQELVATTADGSSWGGGRMGWNQLMEHTEAVWFQAGDGRFEVSIVTVLVLP